jgi:hypothetical protein
MSSTWVLYDTIQDAVEGLRSDKIVGIIGESIPLRFASLVPPCELAVAGDDLTEQHVSEQRISCAESGSFTRYSTMNDAQVAFALSPFAPEHLRDGINQASRRGFFGARCATLGIMSPFYLLSRELQGVANMLSDNTVADLFGQYFQFTGACSPADSISLTDGLGIADLAGRSRLLLVPQGAVTAAVLVCYFLCRVGADTASKQACIFA